jgi:hypothetical protein
MAICSGTGVGLAQPTGPRGHEMAASTRLQGGLDLISISLNATA